MPPGRREIHQEFATELTRLSLAWHIPELTNPDVPALDLLSTILGDGRSSRLYRRVREQAGLAFGVSAFSYTPGDPGLSVVYQRMARRKDALNMPPLGTHRVDREALDVLAEWIRELARKGRSPGPKKR